MNLMILIMSITILLVSCFVLILQEMDQCSKGVDVLKCTRFTSISNRLLYNFSIKKDMDAEFYYLFFALINCKLLRTLIKYLIVVHWAFRNCSSGFAELFIGLCTDQLQVIENLDKISHRCSPGFAELFIGLCGIVHGSLKFVRNLIEKSFVSMETFHASHQNLP